MNTMKKWMLAPVVLFILDALVWGFLYLEKPNPLRLLVAVLFLAAAGCFEMARRHTQ
jgi:hypothetical protein